MWSGYERGGGYDEYSHRPSCKKFARMAEGFLLSVWFWIAQLLSSQPFEQRADDGIIKTS
jgi:hypothetical protein